MPKVLSHSATRNSVRMNPLSRAPANSRSAKTTTIPGEDIDLRKCLICQRQIKPVWDEVYDLKYHYTLCYIKAGRFKEFLAEKSGSGNISDFKQRKYNCPDLCEKRSMIAIEFLIHMGITHEVTREMMAEDTRKGLKSVLTKCFPRPPETHLTTLKTFIKKRNQQRQIIAASTVVSNRAGDIAENPNEEEVDDPGSEPVGAVAGHKPQTSLLPENKIKKENQSIDYFESKPNIKPLSNRTRVNKIHKCLLCDKKDGKSLNLSAEGVHDLSHHYAGCYYDLHSYKNIIDPGPDNKDEEGNPVEEFTKFKYKCPFLSCENTNSKRPARPMGFKEYAIHCAAKHGQLEVAMAKDNQTQGVEEVRLALLRHRESRGEKLEEMPEVIVEEFHTCALCQGEKGKDANLSLHPSKVNALKNHYAICYYDFNPDVYLKNPQRYELEADNLDEKTGKPVDDLGKVFKYKCGEAACKKQKKNQFGFKSYCLHIATDHGGLREIMQEDSRPEIKYILDKLDDKI